MEIKSIESSRITTYPSKKVIVTGVSGQDGSFMVDYLLKNTDYLIYGGVRRLSVNNHKNIEHLIGNPRFVLFNLDITDPHSVSKAVDILQPDYFVNFAAQSFVGGSWDFPEQTWNANCTSVLHMLEAIRKYRSDCRFYNAGTSEEFGDVLYAPQDEKHPPRPRSPYGASKVAARQLVKVYRESYKLYAVQGWLFNHEGTRRGEEFVTRKITKGVARISDQINRGVDVTPITLGNVNTSRDWGDAEDYVDAVWRMVNQESNNYKVKFSLNNIGRSDAGLPPEYYNLVQDYVVATGKSHTIKEFVNESFKCAGIECFWHGEGMEEKCVSAYGDDLVVVSPQFYRPAEVDHLVGDISKIKEELRWEPKTDFLTLVKKMVENDLKNA